MHNTVKNVEGEGILNSCQPRKNERVRQLLPNLGNNKKIKERGKRDRMRRMIGADWCSNDSF